MKQGIFISYRRDTGSTMARMIYDRLRLEKKYQCFLDVETLNAGNFREHIALEMDKCGIFLLILSKNALNRCVNPNDNVRQEIELALERALPIIPVMAEDFSWPEPMPPGLEGIMDLNGVPYIQVYSEQFFERLYSFIETIRAEEKARGSADRDAQWSARMAERSARAKEMLKELGQGARSSLAEAAPPPVGTIRAQGRPGANPGMAKDGTKKKTLPLLLGGAAALILLVVLGTGLLGKHKAPEPLLAATPAAAVKATAGPEEPEGETSAPSEAPSADVQDGPSVEGAVERAEGDQILPESFLMEMEALGEKRLSGLLVEFNTVEFGSNDGQTRDVNTRVIQLEDMELQKDALYFETGGVAAFYLYYQGTVVISEDEAVEYPNAIVAFKLDSFPQKFFSASRGGDINYKNSDFGVFLLVESKEEYLRRVHGSYQYVDHDFYELLLP